MRLPTALLVFSIGVLVWVLVGPRSLAVGGPLSTPTPIAAASITPAPSATPVPLPACGIGDIPAWHGKTADWQTTLLDTTFELSGSYAPTDLVPVTQAGIPSNDEKAEVRAFVIDDLRQLTQAAAGDGAALAVNSAYRSYAQQAVTYDQALGTSGPALAALAVAKPGHSEHQLGTAIDFAVGDAGDAWLQADAWKYGFIGSFPANASPAFTCYKYERWHYRYFGRDTAAAIHNSGQTTREWLWVNAPPPPGYPLAPTPAPIPTPSVTPADAATGAPGGSATGP
jgi:D-alanyl-D-alanine carboxypeptidase